MTEFSLWFSNGVSILISTRKLELFPTIEGKADRSAEWTLDDFTQFLSTKKWFYIGGGRSVQVRAIQTVIRLGDEEEE